VPIGIDGASSRSTSWSGVSPESSEVTEPTRAAGGVVWRDGRSGVEVLLVHRPRYDDWSLPKGHVDRGETLLEAALREVAEETGFSCAAGHLIGITSYTTIDGEPKVVHYWSMTVDSGEFTPNDEVDAIEWASPQRADALLSYDLDRDLIRTSLDAR
jgi:8-oxo-dGTP pyrophosphatase MutT (NUDIX family)